MVNGPQPPRTCRSVMNGSKSSTTESSSHKRHRHHGIKDSSVDEGDSTSRGGSYLRFNYRISRVMFRPVGSNTGVVVCDSSKVEHGTRK